jgi:hypothetical protein
MAPFHFVNGSVPQMYLDGNGLANPLFYLRGGVDHSRIRASTDLSFNFYDGGWKDKVTITQEGTIEVDQRIQAKDAGGLELATDEGTVRLFIKDDGKVGIGTTGPTGLLQVGAGDEAGILLGRDPSLSIWRDVADGKFRIQLVGNGYGKLLQLGRDDEGHDIALMGKVGVGTDSPDAQLHVEGTLEVNQKIQAGDAGGLELATDEGTTRLRIKDDGKVGIGTTDPGELLQVGTGDEARVYVGRNPSLMLARDVADGKLRIQIVGTGFGKLLQLGRDDEGHDIALMGKVGVGTEDPGEQLDVAGTTQTEVLKITGGSDVAEPFVMSEEKELPPGSVVVIDDRNPGNLRLSDRPYDHRVAGVVSGAGGLNPGLTLSQAGVLEEGQHVALAGRVWCFADASFGPIEPGDRLTTSRTPGHAMKVANTVDAVGAVIGKAMTPLAEGQGLVLVLVQPQ